MHSRLTTCLLRLLTIIIPAVVLIGCFGSGDGPTAIPGNAVGQLVNSRITGAEWETSDGESGLTENGLYPYTAGETVTFSVGDIVLGVLGVTVGAAEILTPVELTGSATPTDQAATNMYVFLQTIDENSPNSADGILITAATRAAFAGQTLDFDTDSATFTADLQALLDAVLPGKTIVSEEDALNSFCENTYYPGGGETIFGYPFEGCEYGEPTELLTNGGFEKPDASGGDKGCPTGWVCFNSAITTSTLGPNSAPVSHDEAGSQSLKMFGFDGIAQQDIEAIPGQTYTASVWAMNWTGNGTDDPFGEFGFMQLSFRDANGNVLAEDFVFVDSVNDGVNTYLPPQDGAEVSDWTKLEITKEAPLDAVTVRIFLIHQIINNPPVGGTLRWDDASLIGPPPLEEPPVEYDLVWSDEFDGPELSANNWNIVEGYGEWSDPFGNNEWQEYTSLPENISIVYEDPKDPNNGYLAITALCKEPDAIPAAVPLAVGDNLLSNGDFETPDAFPGNAQISSGTDGWDFAFGTFTVWGDGPDNNGNFGPIAVSGQQTVKNFADGARVEETVAVTGGLSTTLSTYIINWAPDALANNGQALLELTFYDDVAGTSEISTTPLFFGVNDGLTPQDGVEVSDWTLISITETAPINAVSARARLQFIPDGGGAMFWDNASLTQEAVAPPDCVAGKRDGSVTSARINSLGKKSDIRYGKIVGRIKPAVGAAAWPAFWMLGSNNPDLGWPRSGEIDITEIWTGAGLNASNNRTTHSTLHWCPKTDAEELNDDCFDDRVFEGGELDTGSSLGDDFHEFEVIWNPDRITFYIDTQQVYSRVIEQNTMEEFNEDFYLILNLAIGGSLGSGNQDPAPDGSNWELPQTMLIDWVRVYQAVP